MKKRTKKRCSIFLLMLMICIFTVPQATQANTDYSFMLFDSGDSYNVYTATNNIKLYTDRDWVVLIDYKNPEPPYGRGFQFTLLRQNPSVVGSYIISSQSTGWVWTYGRHYAGFNPGQAIENEHYYIGARMDDLYTGPQYVGGEYNSDTGPSA